MKGIRILTGLTTAVALLVSCSETKHLGEDEVLYTGIKEIAYDKHMKKAETQDSTGVIVAMADAYKAVSQILSGDGGDVTSSKSTQLTQEQKDSIEALAKHDAAAYAEAKAQVEGVFAKKPNNSLLGSSFHRFPLPIGLWVYNRHITKDSRWSRWMLNTFGSTPVTITEVNPKVRVQVAENTLHAYGYFHGTADYQIIPNKSGRKAKVSYEVHPGELFRLDTIQYQRFVPVQDSLIVASQKDALIEQGAPFSASKLEEERSRLSNLFRDNGYYYYQTSYITYRADTIMRPLHVQLQVRPSTQTPDRALKQYRLGTATIDILNNEDRQTTDTIQRRGLTIAYKPNKGRLPLKPRAMLRYFNVRPGDLYSRSVQQELQSSLSNMGVFSMLSVEYEPRDTTLQNDILDLHITARLDKPYDTEFKGNVASKSNGLIGPGVSFSMSRGNAFRGAEKVTLDLNASYEWMTGAGTEGNSQVMNSFEYGVGLSLQFPRLTLLTLGEKLGHRRAKASTTYRIEANWMNRSNYFGRVTFGARLTYTYQRRDTRKHEFTPFRLDYNMLTHTTAKFDSIIDRNQALYVSMRDQLVPSMQYSLTMTSRATARNPRTFNLTVKEAGNLTSALYAACGKGFKDREKSLFGVPFAQYVKVTAEFTEQYKIKSTRTYLVGHVFAGAVFSYGNTSTAPYNDLFSIGGANSLRAFSVRSIGPGSYNPGNSSYSYIDELGDLKFEANLEYRFPLVSNLYGAMFVDAGNVWLRKSDASRPGGGITLKNLGKEIALGTGFGFRYDLEFLVIRFDIGIGIHAPYDTGESGYYNMTSFGNSLGYHIAIGYPF